MPDFSTLEPPECSRCAPSTTRPTCKGLCRRAPRRCWRATTSTRHGATGRDRHPGARTCGAITSCCRCPRPEHVVTPRRGHDAAAAGAAARRRARHRPAAVKDDGLLPDRLVQGARRRRRRLPGRGAGRAGAGDADQRQRRRGLGGVRRARPGCAMLVAMPLDAPAITRRGDPSSTGARPAARRRADLRRRPAGRRRRSPSVDGRLVRRRRRSRSPTASRARRRWASRSPSSSAGGCPT